MLKWVSGVVWNQEDGLGEFGVCLNGLAWEGSEGLGRTLSTPRGTFMYPIW